MAEYIERKSVLQVVFDIMSDCKVSHKCRAINRNIKQIPAADVAEVRHGHWIRPNVPNTRSYKWQCSECGQIAYWLHYGNRGSKNIICKFGYCPHCGARMDGGNNNA